MVAMQRPIKLAVGAAGGIVVAAGVVVITASATGLHLAGSSQPAPVTASSPAPVPSASPMRPAADPAARAMNQAAAQAEAQVLGIQPKELAADLRKGTTVHQLADQKGISQADFQARFKAALTPLLDQEVQRGTLTAQQEQQFLKRVGTRIPNWDQAPGQRPTPTPTPTAATTT
jgi:membrane-bound lytic murein transglycosylase B